MTSICLLVLFVIVLPIPLWWSSSGWHHQCNATCTSIPAKIRKMSICISVPVHPSPSQPRLWGNLPDLAGLWRPLNRKLLLEALARTVGGSTMGSNMLDFWYWTARSHKKIHGLIFIRFTSFKVNEAEVEKRALVHPTSGFFGTVSRPVDPMAAMLLMIVWSTWLHSPVHAFLNELNVLDCALPVTWIVNHQNRCVLVDYSMFTGEVMPISCTMLASQVCFSIILSIVSDPGYYAIWFSINRKSEFRYHWEFAIGFCPGGMVSMAWFGRPWTRTGRNELPLVPNIEFHIVTLN